MSYAGFGYGSLPIEDLTIAPNKQYTFVFSSWKSVESIQAKLVDIIPPYSSGFTVTGSGLTTITVTLNTVYAMPLSAWKGLFSEGGLTDMTDVMVGSVADNATTDTGFHPIQNIETYYAPIVQDIKEAAGSAFSFAKTGATYLIVGGIAVLLAYGYMQGRGARPTYKSNPRRKRHTARR